MSNRWDFLATFPTAGFKGWSVGWLWIYTGAIWGLVAIACVCLAALKGKDSSAITPPTEWLFCWLGGLTAYSGVSYLQNKNLRETDYGYVERKAMAPAPQTTNVSGAQVNVGATAETQTK